MATGLVTNKERLLWLDALKGIAIILVVIGHIIDGALGQGLFLSQACIKDIFQAIYLFHMPFFFALSGISYAITDRKKDNRHIINFLILYIFWSAFIYIWKALLSAFVNNHINESFLFCLLFAPVPPYWYLIVLVWCYLFTHKLNLNGKHCMVFCFAVLIVGGIATFLYSRNDASPIAKYIKNIFYHYVFFCAGVVFYHNREKILPLIKRMFWLPLAAAAVICAGTKAPVVMGVYPIKVLAVLIICAGGGGSYSDSPVWHKARSWIIAAATRFTFILSTIILPYCSGSFTSNRVCKYLRGSIS